MINPIVVIVLIVLILCVIALYIFLRPKKPILTGVSLLVLILFVTFTVMIDSAISGADIMNDLEKMIVSFVTAADIEDTLLLEDSFNIFACFDIGIFAFTVVFMFIELRTILLSVYSDRTVKNTDKAESDKAAANSV